MAARLQRSTEHHDLGQVVLEEIRQRPELRETEVSAAVEQGIVILTGSVRTKAEKIAVETVAKTVRGVRALANDLEVKPWRARSGTEIARDVFKALGEHIFLAAEDIRVTVRDGCVILEGRVRQDLHKLLAEAEAKRVRGLLGVSNLLEVEPEAPAGVLTTGIAAPEPSNNFAWFETGEAEAG
jgi:osmotically-inducible protein OsmY